MDFDFKHISEPFRMHPGLSRLDTSVRHLTQLNPASLLYREKSLVSRAGAALHCETGFDPSDALLTISRHARMTGILAPSGLQRPLELAFEEDLAVLDAATGTVPWMCVCVPSHWAPEDKLGKSLDEIHFPVADNAALAAAIPHLIGMVCNGGHWERFVWTITPSPRYDQHPRRQARQAWPVAGDPAQFAAHCYLRAERQTFLPVLDGQERPKAQAVFTIRVMLEPLMDVVHGSEQAKRLHDALQSMTATVLAYKNLTAARAPLLAWLSGLAT